MMIGTINYLMRWDMMVDYDGDDGDDAIDLLQLQMISYSYYC
jgi:hypothetical protein